MIKYYVRTIYGKNSWPTNRASPKGLINWVPQAFYYGIFNPNSWANLKFKILQQIPIRNSKLPFAFQREPLTTQESPPCLKEDSSLSLRERAVEVHWTIGYWIWSLDLVLVVWDFKKTVQCNHRLFLIPLFRNVLFLIFLQVYYLGLGNIQIVPPKSVYEILGLS